MGTIRILGIGDIVGRPGRRVIQELLPELRRARQIDFVVGNGENVSGGSGLRPQEAEELFGAGVDVLTGGDHVWGKRELIPYIDKTDRILRPANYPAEQPGAGFGVYPLRDGLAVGVVHVQGRVFMNIPADCPFKTADAAIEKIRARTPIVVVDFHGEATSEKVAAGWHLDGRASFIFGTHTHVQTADERVLPHGTAYITDCGMTGPYDSVIGRRKDVVIQRFLTQIPAKFDVATDDPRLCGALATIDAATGRAVAIERVMLGLDGNKG
jgi:metallophosphoesterase (TIGR00282 family)